MKQSITEQGAQGDVYFRRVPSVPDGYTQRTAEREILVAHSETGHHHVVNACDAIVYEGPNPLIAYLRLETADPVDVTHKRSFDTHGTVCLTGGVGAVWEVRRQREYDPAGERRAAD